MTPSQLLRCWVSVFDVELVGKDKKHNPTIDGKIFKLYCREEIMIRSLVLLSSLGYGKGNVPYLLAQGNR